VVQKSGIDGCATTLNISTPKALIVLCTTDISLDGYTGRISISSTVTLQEVCRVKIVLDETSWGRTEKSGSINSLSFCVNYFSCTCCEVSGEFATRNLCFIKIVSTSNSSNTCDELDIIESLVDFNDEPFVVDEIEFIYDSSTKKSCLKLCLSKTSINCRPTTRVCSNVTVAERSNVLGEANTSFKEKLVGL